jgi:hypothetical protein
MALKMTGFYNVAITWLCLHHETARFIIVQNKEKANGQRGKDNSVGNVNIAGIALAFCHMLSVQK